MVIGEKRKECVSGIYTMKSVYPGRTVGKKPAEYEPGSMRGRRCGDQREDKEMC